MYKIRIKFQLRLSKNLTHFNLDKNEYIADWFINLLHKANNTRISRQSLGCIVLIKVDSCDGVIYMSTE